MLKGKSKAAMRTVRVSSSSSSSFAPQPGGLFASRRSFMPVASTRVLAIGDSACGDCDDLPALVTCATRAPKSTPTTVLEAGSIQAKMLHRFDRRDDANALVLYQLHQMWTPGNHEIGFGSDGTREHRVVVGSSKMTGGMIAGTTTVARAA